MVAKNTFPGLAVVGIAIFLVSTQALLGESRFRTWDLHLKGTASGGEMVLMCTYNRSVEYVSILTSPNESAGSVVSRLCDAINGYVREDPRKTFSEKHRLWEGGGLASISGGAITLSGRPESYALAGTETGLGIPMPPSSLCASLVGKKIVLQWINPPRPYDFISVQIASMKDGYLSYMRLPGSAELFTLDQGKTPVHTDDIDFRVTGFRDKIPSNLAAIHLSGHCQAELYGIPFTDNIAPNWKAWTGGEKAEKPSFACMDRYPQMGNSIDVEALSTTPFYQGLGATGGGASHGIYRKFLGLIPGHTYRLGACVSTLDMDSVTSAWSFSVCATPGASSGPNLTVQQMAGAAPLPNGTQGPKAGCAASFAPGRTTKGRFNFVFTGERNGQGEEVAHITLPPGADSITVWLRFSCSDAQGKVAFSGVMLEDITANPNVTPPEKVREAAYKAEERLMRGMAEQLERKSPPK